MWVSLQAVNGDIKSTAAETQRQFEEAVRYFDYDRQRARYMDIAGSDRDVLIGISKKNFKVFKVPIARNSNLYNTGRKSTVSWLSNGITCLAIFKMEYVLLEDAVSVFQVIYDRKGAKVTVIAIHGDVAIVENKRE